MPKRSRDNLDAFGLAVSLAAAATLLLSCQRSPASADPEVSPSPTPVAGWSAQTPIGEMREVYRFHIYSPRVSLGASGVALAVWQEDESNGRDTVWAARYQGGTWSSPQSIGFERSETPRVAALADGKGLSVWSESAGVTGITSRTLWAARFSGSAWEAPVRVSAAPAADYQRYAMNPEIAADGSAAWVVWMEQDSSTPWGIWAARFDGGTWSAPERLSSGDRSCGEPQVASDGAGGAVVVWRQDTNPGDAAHQGLSIPNIWARRYARGQWEPALRIGSADLAGADGAERPRLAMNASGAAVAAWSETRGATTSAMGAVLGPSGWSAPAALGATGVRAFWPEVAIAPSGAAMAVWGQVEASGKRLYAARFAGTWAPWELLDGGGADATHARVGLDGDGNATVAWVQAGIRVRRWRAAGGGWEAEAVVGKGDDLDLGVNAAGRAVLVYGGANVTGFAFAAWANVLDP